MHREGELWARTIARANRVSRVRGYTVTHVSFSLCASSCVLFSDEWPEGTGGSSTISHEELAGRDPAADPQASSASTSSASSGSSSRGQLEPEESRGCMSTMYCSSALFVVLFLAVSGAALVLMRGRIVFMGTIYAVLAHRRRQRHRVAPGLDEENPRSLSRRLQAWSHDSEERTANANGRMRRNQRDLEAEFEAQLIAWTEALSASEARPRPGGSGGGRAMYIRPSQPPQEPAPVSLPAHLQRKDIMMHASSTSRIAAVFYSVIRPNTHAS